MLTTSSADGTTIAYDRTGSGTAVILVGGALCDRKSTQPLAEVLAPGFTVISYDRRGRGDSGDNSPYSVAREIEDLGAVITAVGGTAAVYGHSSGAALVAAAVASGLPVTKVVLHEPPYGPDDEESRQSADESGAVVLRLLAEDRRTEAVRTFLTMAGMPVEAASELARMTGMAEVAPSLAYDFAVMDHGVDGGGVPFGLLGSVKQPTLVVTGSASPPFMVDAARAVAKALPDGRLAELDGQHHVVPADVLAPVLTEFLGD